MKLGVNIDHVATLRQARYRAHGKVEDWAEPRLIDAVRAVERAGAHGITMHLREDRRHIQDSDVWMVRRMSRLPLNLEMSVNNEILKIALKLQPAEVCLVPERREEITTEGGLNVVKGGIRIRRCVEKLKEKGVVVSLFIAPDAEQIKASAKSGAEFVELHTGAYAEARSPLLFKKEVKRLRDAADLAASLGLGVNAGHGLRCSNLEPILSIPHLETLNIGHSIVSRAMVVGMEKAVKEMLQKMRG